MKRFSHLLWALGINGEGSARITSAFIRHICATNNESKRMTAIVYSSRSTLDELITESILSTDSGNHNPHVQFIRLPKIFRNYLIHFLIKAFINPLLFSQTVVVFDDYPFRHASRQVLYFHQANLIYNEALLWRVKRFSFRLLLSSSLIVFIQTNHMRDAFVSKFGRCKTMCFLHSMS